MRLFGSFYEMVIPPLPHDDTEQKRVRDSEVRDVVIHDHETR